MLTNIHGIRENSNEQKQIWEKRIGVPSQG
jgi:hypothetical protein